MLLMSSPEIMAILNNFWGIATNDFNLSHDESTNIKSLLGRCRESQVATSHREQGLTFSPTYILRWDPKEVELQPATRGKGILGYVVPMLCLHPH